MGFDVDLRNLINQKDDDDDKYRSLHELDVFMLILFIAKLKRYNNTKN